MEPKYMVPELELVWSEAGKYERMLQVELANCDAWGKLGVIPEIELQLIHDGARLNWETYRERLALTRHDVSSFVYSVAEEINRLARSRGISTNPGRWNHYKLTSMDPQDSALAMQIFETLQILTHHVQMLMSVVKRRGIEHWCTKQMGRTHGMHAEPITFGSKLANFFYELMCHLERLEKELENWNIVKISGPVGSHENVPKEIEETIAETLGKRPIPIATQVISRVKVLSYLNLLNEIGASIEKMATDLRDLQRPEIYEVEEDFPAGAEGSSIMVHKHNPEVGERLCSLARQLAGIVVTARMNVPLWHERDLTNSANERHILTDSAHIIVYMVQQMTWVVDTLHVHPKRMLANLNITDGVVRSSSVLNLLVEKGVDRSVARRAIEPHVKEAWDRYRDGDKVPPLRDLLATEPIVVETLGLDGIAGIFDPDDAKLLEGVKVSFRRLGWEIPD